MAQAIAHQIAMMDHQQQQNPGASQFAQHSPQASQASPINLYESLAAAAAYNNSLQMQSIRDLITNAAYGKLFEASVQGDCDRVDDDGEEQQTSRNISKTAKVTRKESKSNEDQQLSPYYQYPIDLSSPPPSKSSYTSNGSHNATTTTSSSTSQQQRQSVIKSNGLKKSFSQFNSPKHSEQSNGSHLKQRMSGELLILFFFFFIVSDMGFSLSLEELISVCLCSHGQRKTQTFVFIKKFKKKNSVCFFEFKVRLRINPLAAYYLCNPFKGHWVFIRSW